MSMSNSPAVRSKARSAWDTKTLVSMAMLTGIAYIVMLVSKLHVLNSFVLSELLSHMVSVFPDAVQKVLEWGMMPLFFLSGGLVLWKNRRSVTAYLKS